MPIRVPRRLGAIAAIAILVAVACGTPTPPSTPAAAQPLESAQASAGSLEPPSTLPAEIQHAIDQRQRFGLRSDLAWVEALAVDPRATIQFLDFPMLPEEVAAVQAQQAGYDAVIHAVNRYAAGFLDEFGGVYIDNQNHVVVALWTARVDTHRIGILDQLGRMGPLRVRQVRYSERVLRALQEKIGGDLDWIRILQARTLSVGVDTIANLVDMEISSRDPVAAGIVAAHYGVPPDMLRVTSDGTGVALMPWGTVKGTVVTTGGHAPGANSLILRWRSDGPGDCGGGDIGYGVGADGSFELPCIVGTWTMFVQAMEPGGWTDVGHGQVVVPANGTVHVRIVLDAGANLRG